MTTPAEPTAPTVKVTVSVTMWSAWSSASIETS